MTDKEVLQKAIEIAIKNGYKEPFVFGMGSSFSLDKFQIFKLYFSHDFAKNFFGDGNINSIGYESYKVCRNILCNTSLTFWQYHLQQMVLEEKPIDYLRKFIEE